MDTPKWGEKCLQKLTSPKRESLQMLQTFCDQGETENMNTKFFQNVRRPGKIICTFAHYQLPIIMKTTVPPPVNHPGGDKRLKMLNATIKRHQYQQDALIEILHRASELFGYLELDLLLYISHQLKLPPSRVYGVATFYHLFSLAPKGKHNCVVCTGTACYVKGSQAILTTLEIATKIKAGDTTPDGEISLLTARCLGACGIAPAVVLDGAVLGNQTPESVCEKVGEWQNGT